MAIGMKQQLKMTQSLVMTPQLQQAIKLLQLSRLELENLITQEMVENPILEETHDVDEDEAAKETKMEEEARAAREEQEKGVEGGDTFDWESYVESYNPSMPSVPLKMDETQPFENVMTKTTDLNSHLMWQLQMTRMSEDEERIATLIIGNLNDDGFLKIPLEELAAKEGVSIELCENVLKRVQGFDPVGVASRDLKECLLVQARQLPTRDPNLETLIENHLVDLEKKSYPVIAKAMNLPLEKVFQLTQVISQMEPRPGRSFSSVDTHYVTPDVYVYKRGGEYVVSLNEDGLPRLRISNFYKSALQGKQASQLTKEYIQDKLRSAVWLIRSIHQRQQTIYKVTESIVKHQAEFLDNGITHLKPLVLRDVADDIGMHESTVSRVTTNKYVHTQQGIFELKFFFNTSIGKPGELQVASQSVKERIKTLVAMEDPKHPISDQRIVEMLQAEGIAIARRTVAKYRDILGVLPSSRRKKYF
ncbi:MAG: RNA polymerase factor sigma-54 [Deltaproteobacteria bacterium]